MRIAVGDVFSEDVTGFSGNEQRFVIADIGVSKHHIITVLLGELLKLRNVGRRPLLAVIGQGLSHDGTPFGRKRAWGRG